MSSPAFVTCLQHHIPRTQQNQAFPVTQTLISVHKEIIVWDEKMHTKPQKPCVSGVFLYPRIFMGCPETWWKFVDM